MNTIYDKNSANSVLNGDKIDAFPLRCRKKDKSIHYTTDFTQSNQQEKINKKHENQKRRSTTVTIFRWHDMICRNPKDPTKNALELVNKFSEVSGY